VVRRGADLNNDGAARSGSIAGVRRPAGVPGAGTARCGHASQGGLAARRVFFFGVPSLPSRLVHAITDGLGRRSAILGGRGTLLGIVRRIRPAELPNQKGTSAQVCTGAVHLRTSYHRVLRYVKDFRPSDLRLRPSERVEVVCGAGASSSGARSSKSRTSSSKRCPCCVRRTTSRLLRALLSSRLEPGAIAAPRRSHPISATAARTRHSINKLRQLAVPAATAGT